MLSIKAQLVAVVKRMCSVKQRIWMVLRDLVCLVYFITEFASAARISNIDHEFTTENAREVLRLSKAAEIFNYMHPQVDPCDDFYRYACGNWQEINPARFSDGKTSIFNVLKKAYNRRVVRWMRKPKQTSESDMDRKVKYFFKSCMNKGDLRKNYRQKLLSVLEEFGGMPALKGSLWQADKFDWLEVVAGILRKYGTQIILGADIFADLANNDVNRLYLGQLDKLVTTRAAEYYAVLTVARQMEMHTVLGMSEQVASKTATEIVDFERRLAEGKIDAVKGFGMEDKAQLTLLEVMTDNYKPTLNFTHFVNIWLGHSYVLPVYEYVEPYINNLCRVIEETPKEVVANYIMWELLQDFRMEANDSDEKHRNRCVDRTKRFFVRYLDHIVYQQLFTKNEQIYVELQMLWFELKNAFRELLLSERNNWMSNTTRNKALEKLSAMSMEINSYNKEDFEQQYDGLVISTDSYFKNVLNILELRGRNYRMRILEPPKLDEGETLNFTPAYAAEYNKVLIPVAFLQPRFLWDSAYPSTLKYSTIGFIIAHEIAHGFDAITRKYDARGNLNNWWDRTSTEDFTNRKECLKQQYSGYRYNGRKLPKTNNQDENIADNVGVRIAYNAFLMWMRQNNNNSTFLQYERLPNINLPPQQLFFLSLAQVWCAHVNRNWREVVVATDVHPPEEVRVIGMLSNFNEFANEFKCGPNARMSPKRRCLIY